MFVPLRAAAGDVSKQNKTQAANQPVGSEGEPGVLFLHLLQLPQCSCCKMETRPLHSPCGLCCSEPKAMTHKGPPKTGPGPLCCGPCTSPHGTALLWSSAAPSLFPIRGCELSVSPLPREPTPLVESPSSHHSV